MNVLRFMGNTTGSWRALVSDFCGPKLKNYVTCGVQGHLLVFLGLSAPIVIEVVLLNGLSVQFTGPCMGRMLLGDVLTSSGDDIIISA